PVLLIYSLAILFLSTPRPHPSPPLFPYTTLFRSSSTRAVPSGGADRVGGGCESPGAGGDEPSQQRRQVHGPWRRDHGERRAPPRSEEHTSELQSRFDLVCRLLLEKKKKKAYDFYD